MCVAVNSIVKANSLGNHAVQREREDARASLTLRWPSVVGARVIYKHEPPFGKITRVSDFVLSVATVTVDRKVKFNVVESTMGYGTRC